MEIFIILTKYNTRVKKVTAASGDYLVYFLPLKIEFNVLWEMGDTY